MTKIYTDNDLFLAIRQRNRLINIFIAVAVVYLFGLISLTYHYIMLPFAHPNGTWYTVGASAFTVIFVVFAFLFLGISVKRSSAYCKMLKYISIGLKEYIVAPFEGIEDWTTHDGVDVNVALFTVRGVKKDELMTRHIYIDGEKDFPSFEEGDVVKMIVQGNLLVEYEIEKKGELLCEQC